MLVCIFFLLNIRCGVKCFCVGAAHLHRFGGLGSEGKEGRCSDVGERYVQAQQDPHF
jgi:hypothetical protein